MNIPQTELKCSETILCVLHMMDWHIPLSFELAGSTLTCAFAVLPLVDAFVGVVFPSQIGIMALEFACFAEQIQ